MIRPSFLHRMRLALPSCNFAVFCVWLFLSINTVPGRAQCCRSTSSKCDNRPCGDNQRKVTYTFDPSTLPAPLGNVTLTWEWSIVGPGVNVHGTISSVGTATEDPDVPGPPVVTGVDSGSFCAPIDKSMSVSITPGKDQTPSSSSSQNDPRMDALPPGDSYGGFANPLPTENLVQQDPPYMSGSLLRLTWCGGCSDSESSQGFSEGANQPFSIPKESGNSTSGSASGSLESVHFRINLGRRNGKTTELVIGKQHVAECLNPASVEFPSIANRYILEIWRWTAYLRDSYAGSPSNVPPIGRIGQNIESTGSRTIIPFFGREGYHGAFTAMGVIPRGRGANNLGFSPKPIGVSPSRIGGELHFSDLKKPFYLVGEAPFLGARLSLADSVTQQDWNTFGTASTDPGDLITHYLGGISIPPGPADIGAPLQSDGTLDDYVRGYLKKTESDMITFASPDDDVEEGGIWEQWHSTDWAYSITSAPGAPPTPLWLPGGVGCISEGFGVTQHPRTDVTASYNVRAEINSPDSTLSSGENGKDGAIGPDVVIEIHDLRARPAGSLDYEIRAYWRQEIVFSGDDYTLPAPFAIWTVRAESALLRWTPFFGQS